MPRWRGVYSLPFTKCVTPLLLPTHFLLSFQSVLEQIDRDDRIRHLVEVISDVFAFVKDANEVKKIASHGRILVVMAQQTTECAYFIRDYAMKGFCMSVDAFIFHKIHFLFL